MNRAYSLLTIKAVDEDQRIITGIATTPTPDRVGDVVEPKGAEFSLPIPFLWQHDSRQPLGHVTKAKVTANGIEITAELVKVDEPGKLKDRLDEAWQSIKAGLVRGLSIGFKELEYSRLDDGSYGYRFIRWLWLELSAVTIAANGDCSIQSVKSIDTTLRAASGHKQPVVVRLTPPASGKSQHKVKPKEGQDMKTVSEQISALEAKRAANLASMQTATQKSIDEGRSMDTAEQEAFDNADRENDAIDADLSRLKKLEATLAKTAKPVRTVESDPTAPLAATPGFSVKAPAKPEPGIRLARYARCIGLAHHMKADVVRVATELYSDRDPTVVAMIKAAGTAIGAMNTTTDSALVGNEGGFADFVEFLRPRTIVGRFGMNGIPALRSIPFYVPLVTQASGGTAYWVGEGDGIPLTKPGFSRTELTPLEIAAIAVSTAKLLRNSSPAAEALIRDDLANAVIERLDLSFVDPASSGNAGVNPASISNGAASIVSSGGDAEDIRMDVRAVMQKFIDAKNPLTTGVWLMSTSNALALSMMKNALGQPEFPAITLNGGVFEGLPVITSEHMGSYVVLVNATDVWFADEGGINLDMSTEASLQMVAGNDEGSTQNSITPTATSVVNMFQTNSVAFRVIRSLNWARRRTSAVAVLSGVAWGGPVPAS